MSTMSEALEATMAARRGEPKPIDVIREAMHRMHRLAIGDPRGRAYMSIPADPNRDADLILSAALDELESLRADLARVSEEFDLPPRIGPAPGEIRRIRSLVKALVEERDTAEHAAELSVTRNRQLIAERDALRNELATAQRLNSEAR